MPCPAITGPLRRAQCPLGWMSTPLALLAVALLPRTRRPRALPSSRPRTAVCRCLLVMALGTRCVAREHGPPLAPTTARNDFPSLVESLDAACKTLDAACKTQATLAAWTYPPPSASPTSLSARRAPPTGSSSLRRTTPTAWACSTPPATRSAAWTSPPPSASTASLPARRRPPTGSSSLRRTYSPTAWASLTPPTTRSAA